MIPKKKLVGQGISLSDGDIEVLRRMYGCSTQGQEFIQWPRDYCPEGSYVYGYRVLTHTDTALNSMELICRQPNHNKETRRISSRSGSQGTWSQDVFCGGLDDPAIGFSAREQSHEDVGELNLIKDVKLICKGEHEVLARSKTNRVSWQPTQRCPHGFAVVGLRTREQGALGEHDGAALSGLELVCMPYV